MHCTSCGQALTEGQKFCTNCGAPVLGNQQTNVESDAGQRAAAYQPYQAPYQQATQGVASHGQQPQSQAHPQQTVGGAFDPTQIPGYDPNYQPSQAYGEPARTSFNPYGGQPYGQPEGQPYGQPVFQPNPSMGQPVQHPKKKSKIGIVILILVLLLIVGPVACGACALLAYEGGSSSSGSGAIALRDGTGNGLGADQMVGTWTFRVDDSDLAFKLDSDGSVQVSEGGSSFTHINGKADWECYGTEDGMCIMTITVSDEKEKVDPFQFQVCFPDGAKAGNLEGEYAITLLNLDTFSKSESVLDIQDLTIGFECKSDDKAELKVSIGSLNQGIDGTWTEIPVRNGWGIAVKAEHIGTISITHYK